MRRYLNSYCQLRYRRIFFQNKLANVQLEIFGVRFWISHKDSSFRSKESRFILSKNMIHLSPVTSHWSLADGSQLTLANLRRCEVLFHSAFLLFSSSIQQGEIFQILL